MISYWHAFLLTSVAYFLGPCYFPTYVELICFIVVLMKDSILGFFVVARYVDAFIVLFIKVDYLENDIIATVIIVYYCRLRIREIQDIFN